MKTFVVLVIGISLINYKAYPQTIDELENKSLFNDCVTILVPKAFDLMTAEQKEKMFKVNDTDKYVYTNTTGTINLVISHTDMKSNQDSIESHLIGFRESFSPKYPKGEWIDGGVLSINGRKIGFQEIVTPTMNNKNLQSLMFFTDMRGNLLLINFSCPQKEFKKWSDIAYKIRNSLLIKE